MILKILFVSHEVSPFAKVGGLADVIGSLPPALKKSGHDVRILMPAYRMVRDHIEYGFRAVLDPSEVAINPVWSVDASVWKGELDGVPVYLLRAGEWFDHTVSSETIYLPGEDQHIAFAKASLEILKRLEWIPDVIHTHDWHTGLLPVYLHESKDPVWENTASVHTIHNLAYQGVFEPEVVTKAGLPGKLFNMHQLETWGKFNFLKAAMVFADRVNTVSPTYAQEIQTEEYGCTLHGVTKYLAEAGRLSGILNGIDMKAFDPEHDPRICTSYSADKPEGKAGCRESLLQRLGWIGEPEVPIAGIVTRLSNQKGFDIFLEAVDALAELPLRVVVLGVGEPDLVAKLDAAQAQHKDRLKFIHRFDVELAQRIYAGSDMFLMPSAFEPCGLGQLIAMRYGSVPVVRKTGGLADTVVDGENGFVFEAHTAAAFIDACRRAVETYRRPESWRALMQAGMRRDSSWEASAAQYLALYEEALSARKEPCAAK